MQLQLAHKDEMELSVIDIDGMKIVNAGVELAFREKRFLIGASYIESLHVSWSESTIWLGITSKEEAKSLHKHIREAKVLLFV